MRPYGWRRSRPRSTVAGSNERRPAGNRHLPDNPVRLRIDDSKGVRDDRWGQDGSGVGSAPSQPDHSSSHSADEDGRGSHQHERTSPARRSAGARLARAAAPTSETTSIACTWLLQPFHPHLVVARRSELLRASRQGWSPSRWRGSGRRGCEAAEAGGEVQGAAAVAVLDGHRLPCRRDRSRSRAERRADRRRAPESGSAAQRLERSACRAEGKTQSASSPRSSITSPPRRGHCLAGKGGELRGELLPQPRRRATA